MLYQRNGDAVRDYVDDKHALILQISNCISCKIHQTSFAWSLYQSLPYSSPYLTRKPLYPHKNLAELKYRNTPGTITFKFPPRNCPKPIVCCLFAQYNMGDGMRDYYAKSRFVDKQYLSMLKCDTKKYRLGYFKKCLNNLHLKLVQSQTYLNQQQQLKMINKIIIPKFIGCRLAGGDWDDYYSAIVDFNEYIMKNIANLDVIIVEKK